MPLLLPGGVNSHVDLFAQRANAQGPLTPRGETLFPHFSLLRGIRLGVQSLALRVFGIDPRPKIFRAQVGKSEEQIAEIPLGIDDDGWYPVNGSLLEKRKAKPGFPASGHPHADRMRHQIARIIKQRSVAGRFLRNIVGAAEIENP